ncbi:hypothetical protein ALQ37_200220 [Pseudomonas syringae pv. aptata]|uniref:Uncharacterized protein n=1 Tax=Pseudomonas syringae pv. aptata TaxID=83167 RepID=A0A3M3WAW4_PSEAP|nr:hypothetical protein ALQ37_200220 [Pseudomonas syringae pv. aptata]
MQRLAEGLQSRAIGKGEACLQAIGIILGGGQVVIENARLQRPQRVDVLNIARTAGHAGDDAIDPCLIQFHQRQQVRGD